MAKKKYYSRTYMRQHYASKTWVSNDGLHVERDYFDKTEGKIKTYNPTIQEDINGVRFIKLNNLGIFKIDEMVISCYCPPKPQNEKTYDIEHIDGNLGNDHMSNLRWTEVTPEYLAAKNKSLNDLRNRRKMDEYKKLKIRVLNDGTIKQGSNILTPFAYLDCRDLDWFYHTTTPKIKYEEKNRYGGIVRKSKPVDIIMSDFGFVKGDRSHFKNPVILHVNNDYMDFTPGNLEWCEITDQRYIDYHSKTQQAIMEKDKQHNKRWLSPSSWSTVYGDNEPYQDWSEFRGLRPEQKKYEEYWTPEKVKEELERIEADKAKNDKNI